MNSTYWMLFGVSIVSATFGFGPTAQAKPLPPCGTANVIAGADSCETVAVKFDLSGCDDTQPEGAKLDLKCEKGKGTAMLTTDKARYRVDLKETTDSFGKATWQTAGTVLRATLTDEPPPVAAAPSPKAKPAPVKPAPVPAPKKVVKKEAPKPTPTPVHRAPAPVTYARRAPTPAAVPSAPSPFKFSGHLRLRPEQNNFTDFKTNRAYILLRVRPGLTFTPSNEVSVFFEPQYARAFGEENGFFTVPAAASTPPGPGTSLTQTSGVTFDNSLSIHEAYVDYHPNNFFKFIGGRQILSYGDELVIGALEWNNIARTFDALRARMTYWTGWTDIFWSKLIDTNTNTGNVTGLNYTPAGDSDLYGMYSSWSLSPSVKAFDLYLLYQRNGIEGSAVPNLFAEGLRAKSNIWDADYRLEATIEEGNPDAAHDSGWQANLELGYTFDPEYKPRLSVEGFVSTPGYNQLYPTTHIWLGYADSFGRKNIEGFAAHASSNFTSEWSGKIDFYDFFRTDTAFPIYNKALVAIGSGAASAASDVATELDLTIKYQLSKATGFAGGYSIVLPETYFFDNNITGKPQWAYLEMTVKF